MPAWATASQRQLYVMEGGTHIFVGWLVFSSTAAILLD